MTEDYAEKSFWLGYSGDYTENPPLKGDLKCDVAVVGGGFAGIATAYYLKKAQPSLKVAVLEAIYHGLFEGESALVHGIAVRIEAGVREKTGQAAA